MKARCIKSFDCFVENELFEVVGMNCSVGNLIYIETGNKTVYSISVEDFSKHFVYIEEEKFALTAETEDDSFAVICESMVKLHAEKNKQYGNAYGEIAEKRGIGYAFGMLENKMHRISSILDCVEATFESLGDSVIDLACYAVMFYDYLKSHDKQ